MKLTHFITVTFGEFQVWYNSGELRCSLNRFVAVTTGSDNKPNIDDFACQRILDKMPHVDLEEEHSVILARVNISEQSLPQGRPVLGFVQTALDRIYLPFRAIDSLHPLTHRAERLLSSRLEEYNVRIGQPLFEEMVEALWSEFSLRRALSGGETLLNLIVSGSTFEPSQALRADASAALCTLNTQNASQSMPEGLVTTVLCYDRHDPLENSDIGYLQDLAVILKKRYGDNSQMTAHQSALRDICKSEDLKQMPIAEILSCERVVKVLTDYEPLTGSSADLHSLVLFLRWKYTSQRKGSVELEEILKNVSECGGKLNRDTIEQAVWLFGFYCGFDKLAGDYYARTPDTHVLVKTQIKDDPCVVPDIVTTPSEPPIAIEKVKKTRKPRTSRKKAASDNQPQLLDTNPLKSARPDGPVPSNA